MEKLKRLRKLYDRQIEITDEYRKRIVELEKQVKKLNIDNFTNCEMCYDKEAKIEYKVCRTCEDIIRINSCC